MAIFPKIQSPCPYKDNLAALMDGDACRMCKRQVHDLTAMTDRQRLDFLAICTGEVCVSYRFRPALAAAAVAAAFIAAPLAAAAQDVNEVEFWEVGGLADLANIELVEDAADAAMADLPVVYENEAGEETTASAAITPAEMPAGS